jgi:hypothetical protein
MYDKEFLAGHAEAALEPAQELDSQQSHQWEENHLKIIDCVHKYMQSNYRTPSITFISESTGISRPTVSKHMRSFTAQPDFTEHAAIYKLMVTDILRQLYSQSIYGSVKAARLYMEVMGILKSGMVVNQNFLNGSQDKLKINEVAVTQEVIDKLEPTTRERLLEMIERNA